MSIDSTKSLEPLAKMKREFLHVRKTLRELGLSLSVWNRLGREVQPFAAACGFCRLVCRAGTACHRARQAMAERISRQGCAAKGESPTGCCLMGVPVYKRRRVVASAVACFPTREMLDEETLYRLCGRLQLDYRVTLDAATSSCRHSVREADDLTLVLARALEKEHTLRVADEELAALSANLATTYEELSLIYRISGTMKLTQQPSRFLKRDVCDELLEVMNIGAAMAIVYSPRPGAKDDMVVVAGEPGMTAEQIKILAAARIAPALSDNSPSFVENHFAPSPRSAVGQAVKSFVAVPLRGEQNMIGILMALNKQAGEFDSVDVKLISAVADQAAVFLTNHRLYADLQDLLMGVVHALTASIDAKDPYTSGHSQRVARISRRLAEECGFPPGRVRQIYLAGLLHDIGKIGVPERVLCKPGRLTKEEFELIKRHPTVAAKILSGIRQLDDVILGILTHHERPDGGGYPQGLRGDEVPIEGRIIGLADCLDAMTSDRAYRRARPLSAVIREIRKHAHAQFDPLLVEKLVSINLEHFMQEIREHSEVILPCEQLESEGVLS